MHQNWGRPFYTLPTRYLDFHTKIESSVLASSERCFSRKLLARYRTCYITRSMQIFELYFEMQSFSLASFCKVFHQDYRLDYRRRMLRPKPAVW